MVEDNPSKSSPSIFASPKPDRQKFSYHDLIEKVSKQDSLIESLLADRKKDAEIIYNLQRRIVKLEYEQLHLQSVLFIKDRVTELLRSRVSNNEQYQRRPSLIIKGIDVKPNENLRDEVQSLIDESQSTTTYDDVDKYHRNGKREGSSQDIIIRFKWHSAKEDFFKHRKSIPRVKSGTIQIQPHLNSERKKLLAQSKETLKWYLTSQMEYPNPPEFVLPDVHGNLMVKMKKQTKNGLFVHFNSISELNKIISINNGLDHRDASIYHDEQMAEYNECNKEEEENVNKDREGGE